MKLKICFLLFASLFSLTFLLNLKNTLKFEKVKLTASGGLGNIKSKEKDWGGLLGAISDSPYLGNNNNANNKFDDGKRNRIAGSSPGDGEDQNDTSNSQEGKSDKKFANSANKVKNAIDCYIEGCSDKDKNQTENEENNQPPDNMNPPTDPRNEGNDNNSGENNSNPTNNPGENNGNPADNPGENNQTNNDPNNPTNEANSDSNSSNANKSAPQGGVDGEKFSYHKSDNPNHLEKNTKYDKPPDTTYGGVSLSKKDIQANIDPRYVLLRAQDKEMSKDNTIRFIATDTTDMESYGLKLFFKGKTDEKKFYSQNEDPSFKGSINECKNYKIINNRLYGKPATYSIAIDDKKDVPIFSDVNIPKCLTEPDNGNLKTNYINIFSLPEGARLDKKCLKDDDLTKNNSCLPYIRLITSGVLHALKLFNTGNVFYKHGNILPRNIYLHKRNETEKIFVDNMIFDDNKYDNVNQKPFKADMDMLADTLIQLIAGTDRILFHSGVTSPFQMYHTINKYFTDNNFDINLKSAALNMADILKEDKGKCVTAAEMNYRLQKTAFNLIFRLKTDSPQANTQFMDVDEALKHDFIKSGMQTDKNVSDKWDALPADY